MSGGTSFSSVLIANRGEIALRIMRSARAAGLRTIAVYTDADQGAPHVGFADRAQRIGAGPAGESYLSHDAILKAALDSGAEAIHPGYGFLSENAQFARACQAAGLVFIGPPPEVIEAMGNKATAKRLMHDAGVPCLPGYDGAEQSCEKLAVKAAAIGYPVMIKAAAGGGGRGMRLVKRAVDFADALARAKSEATNSFGSGAVILERALTAARHIEVQIFADTHGNVIHLGERDCSLQRRHQKIIEEAGAPDLDPALRRALCKAAVRCARAAGYRGAGTVEFLLDDTGGFYFLEMNTRLQVEHPVTEMVTGLDLVALQFAVAAARPLPVSQEAVRQNGHAIEARLYAENPAMDFLPATGRIARWHAPRATGVRVDTGIAEGQEVTAFYDPMLAKIIAWGADRSEARQRLVAALENTVLAGLASNRGFLHRILCDADFISGAVTTAFLDDPARAPTLSGTALPFSRIALAAAVLYRHLQAEALARAALVSDELAGWSSAGALHSRLALADDAQRFEVTLCAMPNGALVVEMADARATVTLEQGITRVDGVRVDLRAVHYDGHILHVVTPDDDILLRHIRASGSSGTGGGGGRIAAPMHGTLVAVNVTKGDTVAQGAALAVLEAMKMQHVISAPVAGRLTAVHATAGAQVKAGDLLFEIKEETP